MYYKGRLCKLCIVFEYAFYPCFGFVGITLCSLSQLRFKNIVWPMKRNDIVNMDVILT